MFCIKLQNGYECKFVNVQAMFFLVPALSTSIQAWLRNCPEMCKDGSKSSWFSMDRLNFRSIYGRSWSRGVNLVIDSSWMGLLGISVRSMHTTNRLQRWLMCFDRGRVLLSEYNITAGRIPSSTLNVRREDGWLVQKNKRPMYGQLYNSKLTTQTHTPRGSKRTQLNLVERADTKHGLKINWV